MNAPHLDDDALSAALDQVTSTPTEQAHLASCPTCQARLDQLAAVAEAVAAPVPARPHDEANAAIQRALGPPSSPPLSASDSLPSLAAARTRRRPSRRRWLEAASAVAAAAVVIGGLAVVLGRTGNSSKSSSSAASAAAPSTVAGGPAASSTVVPGQAAIAGGDLGEQSDPSQLARLVTTRLAARASSSLSNAPAAAPSNGATTPCAGPALAAAGLPPDQLAGLRFVAPLRWRGQPALVFVFDRPAPPGGRAGVVMATTGCSVLTTLPL